MRAGTADITEISLPPDDGAVARALADLETKLSAWTTAVAGVQNQFRLKALQLAEAGSAQIGPIEADAASADRSESSPIESECAPTNAPCREEASVGCMEEQPDPVAAPRAAEETEKIERLRKAMSPEKGVDEDPLPSSAPEVTTEEKRFREPTEEEEALLAVLDSESAEEIRMTYRTSGGEETIEGLIAAHNDLLLAPLEPEVQKAIRVKYRMLLGRKSVKELIAQYESEARQQPKSWWERVRG